jgi:hypothetical protein
VAPRSAADAVEDELGDVVAVAVQVGEVHGGVRAARAERVAASQQAWIRSARPASTIFRPGTALPRPVGCAVSAATPRAALRP